MKTPEYKQIGGYKKQPNRGQRKYCGNKLKGDFISQKKVLEHA